jgi:hypothetical protein
MVQALVTLTLLFFLFRNFDWGDFRDLIQKVSVWFYLFSLLVVFAGQLLYTLRWRIVLRSMGMEIPYGQLVRYYLIGTFFNNFLPTAVGGDGAKIYYLGRQEGYFRIFCNDGFRDAIVLVSQYLIRSVYRSKKSPYCFTCNLCPYRGYREYFSGGTIVDEINFFQ